MTWWAWVLLWLFGPLAFFALFASGLKAFELWQQALDRKAVRRADSDWAASQGIDLAHIAYPRFLPGERLP